MGQKITTFLMFTRDIAGKAEEAMNFYVSLFDNSKVLEIARHGEDSNEVPGSILNAVFMLNGQNFICMDSNAPHPFTFTPAISLSVDCSTEEEINSVFAEFEREGIVLMELSEYPFAKKFGWVQDKYGVSWQLIYGRTS